MRFFIIWQWITFLGHPVFVKLKHQSSTIILAVGIKYSVRDLLYGVNNYACPANMLPSIISGGSRIFFRRGDFGNPTRTGLTG